MTRKRQETSNEEFKRLRNELGLMLKEVANALNLDEEQEKRLLFWESNKEPVPAGVLSDLRKLHNSPPLQQVPVPYKTPFTLAELFAGIGGMRLAFQAHGGRTVFASEINKFAAKAYKTNFGDTPHGDITLIPATDVPEHDILTAGFPCQPFSQAGLGRGFDDIRGTLFFDVARIIAAKRPKAFLLENVKGLRSHDAGRTLDIILSTLRNLDYYVPDPEVYDALNYNIPQHRERLIIVGFDAERLPPSIPEFTHSFYVPLEESVHNLLEQHVKKKYTLNDRMYHSHLLRKQRNIAQGKGFGYSLITPDTHTTNTISARYYKDGSEALLYQEGQNPRVLTPRECARLMGFPAEFVIAASDSQAWRQFGNSVCVPMISQIAKSMIDYMSEHGLLSSESDT